MAGDDASTRFPFINLEKALGRAAQLFHADKSGKPMLTPVAFEVWGYSPKSSGAFQTTAALKGYGLIEDEGNNADRRVKLSTEARRYFLDERDDIRAGMLASFALKPPLFNLLWHKEGWSEGVPADTVARSFLKLERHLNDQSARSLLGIFKENIRFAGLKSGVPGEAQVDSADKEAIAEAASETAGQSGGPAMGSQKPVDAVRQPPPAISDRPIIFDMESVTVSARFDNADDLRAFISKLEKLEPLMPPKMPAT